MKGLMFNLLEELAGDAGCSAEAWELVAEFAAADALIDGLAPSRERLWGSDVQPRNVFELPTEAMLDCLTREEQGGQDALDDTQPHAEPSRDWLGSVSPSELLPRYCDLLPRGRTSGFGPSAFARPLDGTTRNSATELELDELDEDSDSVEMYDPFGAKNDWD